MKTGVRPGWELWCDFDPLEGQYCFDLADGRTACIFTDVGVRDWEAGVYYAYFDGACWMGTGPTEEAALQELETELRKHGAKNFRKYHPPVVFLDIDGVLNHNGVYAECAKHPGNTVPGDWLDPECIQRLNTVRDSVDVVYVISSGWRHQHPQKLRGVIDTLKAKGFTGTVVDGTPNLMPEGSNTPPRWLEIQTWLSQHANVTHWAVLDDIAWDGIPSERLVKTNIAVGLTSENVAALALVLKNSSV